MSPLVGVNKRAITRHRDHLSCVECRRKKLKCDRATPCSACVKRDGGSSCTYQRSTTGFEAERERRRKAEGRLEHLEQLVQQLSESDDRDRPTTNGNGLPVPVPSPADNHGSLHEGEVGSNGTSSDHDSMYKGNTHWTAMLDDIVELRNAISMPLTAAEDETPLPETNPNGHMNDIAIIFGAGPILTYEQVLTQYLPERQDAARLVAGYFRSKAVKAPFLHHAHFQRLYTEFWEAPLASSPLFVSLLFSVLHASATSLGVGVVTDNRYAVAAAHCLVIGKHYQLRPHATEALLLYAQTKCFNQLDISPDVGSIFAMVSRTALRMGYHRDPSRLPISPLQQELRRRTWSALLQLDLLISFQLGLPSSILPSCHDTRMPANLQDADFNGDTKELPPSRPDTEETDIAFYIAKHKLSVSFEKILQHVSSIGSFSANADFAIDTLDADIRQTFLVLPQQYRPKSFSNSVFDSPTTIVARFCVNMIYEKCLCVLHRPYVASGRHESVLACNAAASNIIRYFVDAYEEFQPGGQVEMQRWFMSAITWHDFLLGATALCLVACSASRHGILSTIDMHELVALLGRAGEVLEKHARGSRDTAQVNKVVRSVHARFCSNAFPSEDQNMSKVQQQISPHSSNGSAPLSIGNSNGADMDFDWAAGLSQPMIDESWNWLETFLHDDKSSLSSGGAFPLT